MDFVLPLRCETNDPSELDLQPSVAPTNLSNPSLVSKLNPEFYTFVKEKTKMASLLGGGGWSGQSNHGYWEFSRYKLRVFVTVQPAQISYL